MRCLILEIFWVYTHFIQNPNGSKLTKKIWIGWKWRIQKQPSRGVLTKRCPENMQQYADMLCNFIEITLLHGCSPVNLLHIFRTPFPKKTSGWMLLRMPVTTIDSLVHWRNLFNGSVEAQKQPPEMFYKKCFLINFAKFTRKQLCQVSFLIKLQADSLQLY